MSAGRRVLVIGPDWQAGTTESVARAFTACGCTVNTAALRIHLPLPLPPKIAWRMEGWLPRMTLAHCYRHNHRLALAAGSAAAYDLIFVLFGSYLRAETIAELRARTRTRLVLWVLDDPFIGWSAVPALRAEMLAAYRQYHRVYVFDGYYVAALRAHFGDRCACLPLAYDDGIFAPATGVEKEFPAAFVGERFPNRVALLRELPGPVHTFGGYFGDLPNCVRHSRVTPAEANTIYQRTVVNLNCNHPQSVWGTNTRTYEVAGAGGMLLNDARPDLAGQFVAGEEMEYYSSPGEAAEKLRFYLQHPERAAALGARAAARAKREHTFTHRMRQVLADCP